MLITFHLYVALILEQSMLSQYSHHKTPFQCYEIHVSLYSICRHCGSDMFYRKGVTDVMIGVAAGVSV
jgi:hypothetical protein